MHQPDFAFINVTMTFAPPLRTAESVPHESHRVTVMRRRGEIFVGKKIGADLHRRASIAADAIDISRADITTIRCEVNPAAIRGPRVKLIAAVIKGQPLEITRVDRQHIDVAVARARGAERELAPVGRIKRPRFGCRMRNQQVRVAARRRHRPNVAT